MRVLGALASGVFVGLLAGRLAGARRAGRSSRFGSRAASWLAQAGLDITPPQFGIAMSVIGGVTFVITWSILGAWWLAAVPTVAIAWAPVALYGRRRRRRLRRLQEAWPDALRDLVAATDSGETLHQALLTLSMSGPDAVREALARYPILASTLGVVPALEIVRERLSDPTTDKVLEVIAMAHRYGGRLVQAILRDLVNEISADVSLDDEIRSDDTEQRIEGRIVAVAPWVVLLILTLFPGGYRDFYRSSGGAIVVVIGALWTAAGLALMARLRREQPEARVLGRAATLVSREGPS